MSEYLASSNATQRTKIICAAKFPKKVEVAAYGQVRRPLKDALSKPSFGGDDLNLLADRMDLKAQREAGYPRDEAKRCARAVRAFQETFKPNKFSKYQISPSTGPVRTTIAGVKLQVTLDAVVTETKGDITRSGGIFLLYAFSADRDDERERLSHASGLMLWALEGGQIEPLPRLCMAADLAQHNIVKASSSFERFRSRVTDSCSEIASRWASIEPPLDYDGPEWR